MKYEEKVFEIDGKLCHWQLMYSSNRIVCCRCLNGGGCLMSDEERDKYERRIPVPPPEFSKEEKSLLNKVFKTFKADANVKEAVTKSLIWKKWFSAGEKMVEELAKADYERWHEEKKKGEVK